MRACLGLRYSGSMINGIFLQRFRGYLNLNAFSEKMEKKLSNGT